MVASRILFGTDLLPHWITSQVQWFLWFAFCIPLIRSWESPKRSSMNFSELGLSEPILRALKSEGYETPTPIQAQSIPHLLERSDLLGCAQTGTGKTAAFALPILHLLHKQGLPPKNVKRHIRALVLAPTRELAAQISESFQSYGRNTGLRHCVIFGGVNQYRQVVALERGVDIVVATPGRLCDLMEQGYVDLRNVEIFVLDEADRMLDMGFMPDIRRIIDKLPHLRQNLLFSATLPGPIEQLADSILKQPVRVKIAPVKQTTELIKQSVAFVAKSSKNELLARLIEADGVQRAIVFTRTKYGADKVAYYLSNHGIRAEAMHGNKSQNARLRILAAFKGKEPAVLVATDIASRGIDVDGVTHVFNFDLPQEPETYVHRIGRTGRAGANGVAISFCDGEERGLLRAIEREIRMEIETLEHDLDKGTVVNAGRENRSGRGGSFRDRGPRRPGRGGDRNSRPSHNRHSRNEGHAPRREHSHALSEDMFREGRSERAPERRERAEHHAAPAHRHEENRQPSQGRTSERERGEREGGYRERGPGSREERPSRPGKWGGPKGSGGSFGRSRYRTSASGRVKGSTIGKSGRGAVEAGRSGRQSAVGMARPAKGSKAGSRGRG